MDSIPLDIAKKLLNRDFANLVKRMQAGGKISRTERAMLQAMEAGALRDKKGRSLRDLDLHTRLFKFPCSYLIYSPSFDAIAEPIREQILGKLYDLLTGKMDDPQFARLTPEDRTAILEILRETKPNLPAYWRE